MEEKIDEILRIDPTLIDARLRTMLYRIPEDRALHILTDFQKALLTNRESIRNPVAYLMGMAHRVLTSKELPENSRVKKELDRLFREGKITPSDIDERCRDMLKHLPEEKAIESLHELENADVSSLHNVAAFFMGIMKKYTRSHTNRSDDHLSSSQSASHMNSTSFKPMVAIQDLPPAPKVMPSDLHFGFGEQEYIPEMPKTSVSMGFLPVSVQAQLQTLLDKRILIPDDLDDRILNELKNYPEEHAVAIAREFSSVDRESIRNVPSYLVGISRRVPFHGKAHHEERFPVKRPHEYDDRARGGGSSNYAPYADRDRDRDRERERERYPPPSQYSDRYPPPPAQALPPRMAPPPPERYPPTDRYPPHQAHPPPDRYPPPASDRYPPPSDRYPPPSSERYPPPPIASDRYPPAHPPDRYPPSHGPPPERYPPPHAAHGPPPDRYPPDRFPPSSQSSDRYPPSLPPPDRYPPTHPPSQAPPRYPPPSQYYPPSRDEPPRRGYDDRALDPRGMDPRRGYDDRDDPRYRRDPPASYAPPPPSYEPRDPRDYRSSAAEMSARSRVDMEISRQVAAGLVRDEDIDERVRDYLAAQAPWIAQKAIVEFCAKDMSRIHHKPNFLKGIVRKLIERDAEMGNSAGRSHVPDPYSGEVNGGGRHY